MTTQPRIKTTVVGSYPFPDWLGALPSEQRQVIELAYFGGFTHSEIASTLELPVGTVKGRMRLGLGKLRVALGDPHAIGEGLAARPSGRQQLGADDFRLPGIRPRPAVAANS